MGWKFLIDRWILSFRWFSFVIIGCQYPRRRKILLCQLTWSRERKAFLCLWICSYFTSISQVIEFYRMGWKFLIDRWILSFRWFSFVIIGCQYPSGTLRRTFTTDLLDHWKNCRSMETNSTFFCRCNVFKSIFWREERPTCNFRHDQRRQIHAQNLYPMEYNFRIYESPSIVLFIWSSLWPIPLTDDGVNFYSKFEMASIIYRNEERNQLTTFLF
jgi:hypothetical protein